MDTLEEHGILQSDFDMEQYIEQKLMSIEDVEERLCTRTLLKEVFQNLYQYTNKQYDELEKRLQKETPKPAFSICMGIAKKDTYDIADEVMYPLIAEELEVVKICSQSVKEALEQKMPICIYSIYIKADYATVENLYNRKSRFRATIQTTLGEYKGYVYLKRAQRYDQLLQELQEYFLLNGIPWSTVWTAYINKMADVYLEDGEIPEEAEIVEIHVNFGEYEDLICYDYIPIWNIQRTSVVTDLRPVPCLDMVHYKHQINTLRLDEGCYYLIAEPRQRVIEVEQGDTLTITSLEKVSCRWNAYKITKVNAYKYKEVLFKTMAWKGQEQLLRTKAAIQGYVQTLGFEQFVKLINMEVIPRTNLENMEVKTYDMNSFICNEIRAMNQQDVLQFQFQPVDEENYLNMDIVSCLVSQLQRELPEFYCIGKLV